jgi:1-acyl-sn-glycerol-3-phosphate acyltransferase
MKIGSLTIYRLAVSYFDFYFRRNGGIREVGAENVPHTGGVIVAPNHLSWADPPAVACTCRHRRVLAMAKEELWKNRLFGWVIGQIGAFPVRRGEADPEAIKFAVQVLNEGECLLMFPEGTRSDGRRMLPITRGVAMLARKTGVPVVPIGIVGTSEVMPPDRAPKRKREVIVAYGKPFTYAEVAVGGSEKGNREIFARELASRIRALAQEHGLNLELPEE